MVDTVIGIAGIVVAVFFGVLGMRAVKKWRQSQKQKVKGGSVGIQSGRDTSINITHDEASTKSD